MPPFRSGSLLDRLQSAFSGTRGRQALPIPNQSWYTSYGMGAGFKPEESLDAYGHNVWLHRAVLTLAVEMARVPLRLRYPTASGDFKFVERHQALEAIARPQETKYGKVQLTGMMLKIVTFMHQFLNGEAFWVLQKRLSPDQGGGPRYIDVALPQYMYEVLDSDGEIKEYVYRVPDSHDEVHIPPQDVVHFRLPSPKNWLRGHSPLQGIRWAVDGHRKADEMNTAKLDNFASPGGMLETDQAVPEAERHKILADFRQGYGGTKNVGKPVMLPRGLKFQKTQESNQEMQWAEGKTVSRDEILANYGIGLEILGRTESQTRANADAAIFVFERFGVLPFLELFVDTLTNDFLVAYPNPKDAHFFFDDPVPENTEDKRLTADNLFNGGALTPNERRKMFGLEPLTLPGMDDPYLPLGVMPVGQEPPEPDPAPDGPAA